MKDYKYHVNFIYPHRGEYVTIKSNLLDTSNASKETIKKLYVILRKPCEFIKYNFCIPLSYDLDAQMFEIDGSLLLYKDTYKYYSELPHRGNKTYLTLGTINQAMEGKFPKGTDLQTNLSGELTKKWQKDLK